MSLSPDQAAAALHDIDCTERRTQVATGYAIASPYLILWGLVWIAGYGACAVVAPERWGLVWLPLVVIGGIGSGWIGSRGRGRGSARPGAFSQSLLLSAAVFLFIASVYYVFRPASTLPYLVFPSLIAGLVYTLAGALARMARFVWIGAGIFLVTMAGFIAAPQYMAIWVAIAGGGGLLLGGLWLRKV
jgi:hypothetical protein